MIVRAGGVIQTLPAGPHWMAFRSGDLEEAL